MKLLKTQENGRSMIEMLGVLAIVGILSVGGITGYSKAMYKYKIIKLTDNFNLFINNILPYKEGLIKDKKQNGDNTLVLNNFLKNAKLIPESWNVKGDGIYDDFGSLVKVFIRDTSDHLVFDYYLKVNNKDAQIDTLNCQQIFTNVVLQQKDVIKHVRIWGTQESEEGETNSGSKHQYFGTQYCNQNRACLSDITISEIVDFCNDCFDEKNCIFVMEY
ncbi:MAG: type II secretion system GspH family protein [Acetobacter sp.]|nr:type II secretion system GspH family protein [Acetobacter sp.]